jgi:hypothetical protein
LHRYEYEYEYEDGRFRFSPINQSALIAFTRGSSSTMS